MRITLGNMAAVAMIAAGIAGTPQAQAAVFSCLASDVSLDIDGGRNATACAMLDVRDSGDNTYTAALNGTFGAHGSFAYGDKTGGGTATLAGGIEITVTGDVGDKSGDWGLSWKDTAPGTAPNLPSTVDIALIFKASNTAVAYLFDDLLLRAGTAEQRAYEGDFRIRWTNGGGRIPDLSHIFAGVADLRPASTPAAPPPPSPAPEPTPPQPPIVPVTPIPPINDPAPPTLPPALPPVIDPAATAVPEPASLALLGAALFGLGLARRRRPRLA